MKWPWGKDKATNIGPVPTVPFRAELEERAAAGQGEFDPYSVTWLYVRDYCNKRLDELRRDNDNPTFDDLLTAVLRGRIQFAKEILDLPKPKPTAPEQDADADFDEED